jgi:subtilisin-like proprotein convertase family protein
VPRRRRINFGRGIAGTTAILAIGGLAVASTATATAPAAPSGASASLVAQNSTAGSQIIGDAGSGTAVRTSTITIATPQTVIRDVDIVTQVPHTSSGDLKMTLTSPKGTTVLLTDRTVDLVGNPTGRTNDDWFLNTTWDDSGAKLMSDQPLTFDANLQGSLGTVVPEGAMGAFIGENPNGVWTLKVEDVQPDAVGDADTGRLDGWTLRISTMANPAPEIANTVASTATTVIKDAVGPGTPGTPSVTDIPLTVSGQGAYLLDVDMKANIAHPYSSDLEMFLVSPANTVVPLHTRDGVLSVPTGTGFPNLWNGTIWNDNAAELASRIVLTPPRPALVPEGALAALVGQNPNGTWKLRIVDRSTGDEGAVQGWDLRLKSTNGFTTPQPPPPAPVEPTPPTPPVSATKVSLGRFVVARAKRKNTIALNLSFANGTGRISYTATLSTKLRVRVGGVLRIRTVRKVVRGTRLAGAGAFSRQVVVPATWKGKSVTVRLVVKNTTTTVIRTKTLRRF